MAPVQQAARIKDPITHGLGLVGIAGGMLVGAIAGMILIAALPVSAPALVVGLTAAASVGAVAGGGLAGHQLLAGIQRACGLPSPTTGMLGVVGSPNVRIGKLPAARVVSETATTCNGLYALSHLPIPPLPPARIAEGSQTIRINGLFAARVSSKLECGASIQQGSLTVYFGGPTKRVLAVVDTEAAMLSLLGFLAKASLVAAFLLTIPLGLGAVAMFGVFVGGFMAVNYGLGLLGDRLPSGWRDILQGGFALVATIGGSKLAEKLLPKVSEAEVEEQISSSDLDAARGRLTHQMHLRARQLELGIDPEKGYKYNELEGIGGVHIEQVLGRPIRRSNVLGEDFVDSVLGPVSLKGPLPPSGKGDVSGLASSAIQDVTANSATKACFVDLTGLSPEQAANVKTTITGALPDSSKPVFFLE
jgi:uncharacterized Zn-binding protein involved in type VI secretion